MLVHELQFYLSHCLTFLIMSAVQCLVLQKSFQTLQVKGGRKLTVIKGSIELAVSYGP